MLRTSVDTWLEPGFTVRHDTANRTPYLAIETQAGSGELTLFLTQVMSTTPETEALSAIDTLVEALQDLRRELLRTAAELLPDGSLPRYPHASIRTRGELLSHLVVDHGVPAESEALVESTDIALDARHRTEHGRVLVRTFVPAVDGDEDVIVEFDPGPEVDDEGGMSEYRHVGFED